MTTTPDPITVDLDIFPLPTRATQDVRERIRGYVHRMTQLHKPVTIIRIGTAEGRLLRDVVTRQLTRDARQTQSQPPPLAGFTFAGVPVATWGP